MKTCLKCGELILPNIGCGCTQDAAAEKLSFTDPATLPDDVKKKILRVRDALLLGDPVDGIREAWGELYSIADPNFNQYDPWSSLEGRLNND